MTPPVCDPSSQEQTGAVGSAPDWPTNEEAVERANARYHHDPIFHARVKMAERVTCQRLEAKGMTLSTSYLVAVRLSACVALLAAELPL